ncbi:MAG: response regulator transcription factor [Anaerolineae bacterium]|nr:response regulator transcription factor [Anaerolineae bacterium]
MMTAPTILLVEDDDDIAEPLLFGLRSEGYRALHAPDGPRGLEMARAAAPDAILLDVMLPGMDGFTVCRLLRQESAVPILMLTARGQEVDRVTGLELGADDYIIKPFSFRELVARVRAILRRRDLDREDGTPVPRLAVGAIAIDRAARRAWRGERPLDLTPREFDLLAALARQAGQALPRQALLDQVWGLDWIGDPRTLDVHIRWLREKIEDDPSTPRYLQTVRGYGYRLVDPDAPDVHSPQA